MGVVQTVVSGDENSVVAEVVMPASAQRHYGASAKLSHVTCHTPLPRPSGGCLLTKSGQYLNRGAYLS